MGSGAAHNARGSVARYTEATAGCLSPTENGLKVVALNWGGGPGEEEAFQGVIREFLAEFSTKEVLLSGADPEATLKQIATDLGLTEGTAWLATELGSSPPQG